MDSFCNLLEDSNDAESLLQEGHVLGKQSQEDDDPAGAMDSFANSLEDSPDAECMLQDHEPGLGKQNQDEPNGAMDSFCNSLEDSPEAKSLLQEQDHGLGKQNQGDDEPDYSVVLTAVVDMCDICGKTFRQARKLKAHIDAQHKGVRYTCEICGSSMKYKQSLSTHMVQIHNIKTYQRGKKNINKRTCEECKIKFSSNQLLYEHLKEVHNKSKPVSCSACSQKFPNIYDYGVHKHKHAHLVPYRCDVCRLRYASKPGLRVHIESSEHHQKSADWPCHTEFDELDYVCYICNGKWKGKGYQSFTLHLKEHNTNHGNDTRKTRRANHRVKCHICEETMSRHLLKSHLMIQHGIFTPPDPKKIRKDAKPTFKCSECDKTYKDPQYFRLHMKSHSGEPKIQCDQCDYATYNIYDMRKHVRGMHTGEKPYKCPTCNKAFKDQSRRKMCMVKHAGIKCCLCRFCKTSFPDFDSRKKHERKLCPLRAKEDAPPVYECKECNKSFQLKSSLKRHMGSEPEKCSDCDFKTLCRFAMRKHKHEHADVYSDQAHQGKSLCSTNAKADHHSREEAQSEGNMKDAKLTEVCVVKTKEADGASSSTKGDTEQADEASSSIEANTKEADEASSSSIVANTKEADEASRIEASTKQTGEASISIEADEEQNDKDNNTKECDSRGNQTTKVSEKAKPAEQDGETANHLKDRACDSWEEIPGLTEGREKATANEQDKETAAIHVNDGVITQCGSLKLEVEDCDELSRCEPVSFNVLNADWNKLTVSQLTMLHSQLRQNLDRLEKVIHTKESTTVPSMTTPVHHVTIAAS